MSKQSGFAVKQQLQRDEDMQKAWRAAQQFDMDTWQIALARYEKLDLGYQRIMEITELAEQVRVEYRGAIEKGPERDVCRHHLDEELKQIMGKKQDELIPFEQRYPELKRDSYEGRRRK